MSPNQIVTINILVKRQLETILTKWIENEAILITRHERETIQVSIGQTNQLGLCINEKL